VRLSCTCRWSHDFELINWIRGWGKGASVLEPEELREKIEE
jgi:predicted DNA-binding transcriptional regulator YafY